ncbi:MAG: hypothetical protein GYA31_00750 [Parcubacteria group bacterium]|nr:hypothetical protein [Parcubacteria group bacterium]
MKPHRNILSKIFSFVKERRFFILLTIESLLLFSLGFSLGFIKGGHIINRPALIIDKELIINTNTTISQNKQTGYQYVASSKGKYYYPIDCALAENLSEKNKIYFATKEEAEAKGYVYNTKCD